MACVQTWQWVTVNRYHPLVATCNDLLAKKDVWV